MGLELSRSGFTFPDPGLPAKFGKSMVCERTSVIQTRGPDLHSRALPMIWLLIQYNLKPPISLIVLFREGDRFADGLFRSPICKPSLVPTTPPRPLLVRLFLISKSHAHPDSTSIAMVRILKAVFVGLTSLGTILKRCSIRLHSTCLPKLSWIGSYIVPIFAGVEQRSCYKVVE